MGLQADTKGLFVCLLWLGKEITWRAMEFSNANKKEGYKSLQGKSWCTVRIQVEWIWTWETGKMRCSEGQGQLPLEIK